VNEELRQALAQIRSMSDIGTPFRSVRGLEIRRLLLPRTKRHLYDSLDKERDEILIHVVWSTARGRGPKL
jgi:plasmid stabilization system protein ParE